MLRCITIFVHTKKFKQLKKKKKKKKKIKSEFTEIYYNIRNFSEYEGLSSVEKKSLLKDAKHLEKMEIAAVDECDDDYEEDLLNSVDPKLLRQFQNCGFDF